MNALDLPLGNRRYLDIARKLAADINGGTYREGERLPPERELAHMLDVSRTTVREALLALEIMRFIEIRVGAGVFVLGETHRAGTVSAEPEGASPSDVLSTRRLVEAETAALAAQRASDAEISAMSLSIKRMAASIDDVQQFDAADADFHELIARAAGNDVLASLVSQLWRMRDGDMWTFWYDQTRHPENRHRTVADHEVILRAIKRKLPDAARTAMQAHLDVLADRFYQLKL